MNEMSTPYIVLWLAMNLCLLVRIHSSLRRLPREVERWRRVPSASPLTVSSMRSDRRSWVWMSGVDAWLAGWFGALWALGYVSGPELPYAQVFIMLALFSGLVRARQIRALTRLINEQFLVREL